ncbi:hypothetical protein M440DRAFT_1028806 [Trichoderma longibrachiatum ATCC 18648]|uniref:Uncharacterized protein n=1 Tax=Trichoderma longibrachiatum ATCC 18648 TaxID=983965 RepID=A0A2T4BZ08_TRILO|nr:hypothetical protein M440DRAFT_1028806 [Trichoderma longibrachiatum ATCC 18648]
MLQLTGWRPHACDASVPFVCCALLPVRSSAAGFASDLRLYATLAAIYRNRQQGFCFAGWPLTAAGLGLARGRQKGRAGPSSSGQAV